jgi:predicted permease
MLDDVLYRLRALFRRRATEEDLDAELRFHLDFESTKLTARGQTPHDARRAANLLLGGLEQTKEQCRDARGLRGWDESIQNLRYAWRTLVRYPGFSVIAILTMTLGIGVNTALLTIINATLFRPMPVANPENFYEVGAGHLVTAGDMRIFEEQARTVRQLAASRWVLPTLSDSGELLHGNEVSANYFEALGINASIGRVFSRVSAGDANSIVLSDSFWNRHFSRDPSAIGRGLVFGGRRYAVIGVAEPRFIGTMPLVSDFWVLLSDAAVIGSNPVHITARLAPGIGKPQAEAELTQLYARTHPREVVHPTPIGLADRSTFIPINAATATLTALLIGCASIVLAIGCANLANLLLARAATRQREIAVRLSLGATRARIVRQLLTETTLISLLGGTASLLLSAGLLPPASRAIQARMPPLVGYWSLNLVPDFRVFLWTTGLCLIAGSFFGLIPALRATRAGFSDGLREGGGQGAKWSRSRLRNSLVVAQVALCLVLLINAGILVRSLRNALMTDPGFDTDHTTIVQYTSVAPETAVTPSQLLQRFSAYPGVTAAAATHVPLLGFATVEVRTAKTVTPKVPINQVTDSYFAALGIPILRGRSFTRREVSGNVPVIVVSEGAARRLFPGQDAVGQILTTDRPRIVVGVARDTRSVRLAELDTAYLYTPLPPHELDRGAHVLLRSNAASTLLSSAIRHDVGAIPGAEVLVYSFDIALGYQRLPAGAGAIVAAVLGILALVLAVVGIYGVISYVVSQRTREVGIRIALGADRHDVVKLVLRQGMRLVAIGLVLGVSLAIPLSYVLRAALVGIQPLDPLTYTAVPLLLAIIALVAMANPTLRASRIQPVTALRHE